MSTKISLEGVGKLNTLYLPVEKSKACIVLIHGLGEHIERYHQLATYFNTREYSFIGVDLPGHGRSPGRRGHIWSFGVFNALIDSMADYIIDKEGDIPLILYGHSLGGGMALRYLTDNNKFYRGIISSPWIKLSFDPPKFKLILASIIEKLAPGLLQPSGLNPHDISTDKNIVSEYGSDPLIHSKISVKLFFLARNNGIELLAGKNKLKTPVLILHSKTDRITSPGGSSEFASNNKLADIKIWNDGLHELHNEVFREDVLSYIYKWLERKDEIKNTN